MTDPTHNERMRRFRKRHSEELSEYARQYHVDHREKRLMQMRQRYHDLTCAVCRKPMEPHKGRETCGQERCARTLRGIRMRQHRASRSQKRRRQLGAEPETRGPLIHQACGKPLLFGTDHNGRATEYCLRCDYEAIIPQRAAPPLA